MHQLKHFLDKLVTINECGRDDLISCGKYFNNIQRFTIYQTLFTNSYTLTIGYNRILLNNPINATKGALIIINQQSALLSVETTNSVYEDYQISGDSLLELDILTDYRLFFNCLIDEVYFKGSFSTFHQYDDNGIYEISVSSNTTSFSSNVSVDTCN